MLQMDPHVLNGVVIGGVGNVEDRLDAILEQEIGHLLAVMHPAIVQEEDEVRGLAILITDSMNWMKASLSMDRACM